MDDINAILLVGGRGTRLSSVIPSIPKPLASVGDQPFLELLIRQLRHQGIHRLVMCTGHLADQIEKQFGDGRDLRVEIRYSNEQRPLGTAGAVKLARQYFEDADDFLVMNGDSFVEMDFQRLVGFHREHRGLVSMAVRSVPNASRYGTVQVDTVGRVTGLAEKTGLEIPGLVNAGVYVFDRTVPHHIPAGAASLELDVFPKLVDRGVYALEQHGMFIDIGTPEDYARAQAICDRLRDAAVERRP